MKKKTGLALGSGAVRGLAHIGVLKVLEEKNIDIDIIAGSSIGAIIGAMYASGKTIEEIEKIAHSIDWKGLLKLADPVLGRGMFKGNKLKNFLAKHINATTFEELKIPMVIVATDIKTGQSLEITNGDLLDAVRASISVPFVFAAVKVQGHTCGDAGLSQPVPVEALQKMGAKKIIAVDLDAVFFKKNNRGKVAKIDSIALNSINLMRYNLAKCNTRDADIVITPESRRIYWNRFVSPQSVIDAGEIAAKKML